eukprot:1185798-Prorocentrum_minimum.AAC.2
MAPLTSVAQATGAELPATVVFDYPSTSAVAQYLASVLNAGLRPATVQLYVAHIRSLLCRSAAGAELEADPTDDPIRPISPSAAIDGQQSPTAASAPGTPAVGVWSFHQGPLRHDSLGANKP